MEVEQPVEEQVQEAPLDRETAIQKVLKIALTRGTVVKGISEVLKALEAKKVKVVFLADNCDNDQYKSTVTAVAKEHKVPIINIDTGRITSTNKVYLEVISCGDLPGLGFGIVLMESGISRSFPRGIGSGANSNVIGKAHLKML